MTRRIKENLLLTSTKFMEQKEFWLKKLSGNISKINIFAGNHPDRKNQYQEIKIKIPLADPVVSRIEKLGKQSGMAIYVILLTALKAFIHRYTGMKDIIVISPLYQKYISDETMNNSVLILDQVYGDASFKDLLLKCKQAVLEAYENQDYPFQRLFEVMFKDYQSPGPDDISDVVCELKNIHQDRVPGESKDKIVFSFQRIADTIRGYIIFNSAVYSESFVQQISRHFAALLENAIFNMDKKISNLPMLSQDDKEQLIHYFNRTEQAVPRNKTLSDIFAQQVIKKPGSIALMSHSFETVPGREQHVSFQELNHMADCWSYYLREKGVKPGCIIGIMAEPSIEMIVTLLGILKAGGAYLPIEPGYPEERKRFMLTDSGAHFLVVTESSLKASRNLPEWQGEWIRFNHPVMNHVPAESPHSSPGPGQRPSSESLAYVIFTSGTTGRPKGVLVEHQNAVNTVTWFSKTHNVCFGTRVLLMSDVTFDPSVNQIFGPLLHGGSLSIVPRDMLFEFTILRHYIVSRDINILNFVPCVLNELLGQGPRLSSVRAVLSGGERLDDSVKTSILKRGYPLYNQYGPTETTIDALVEQCSEKNVSLGTPISNVRCHIRDRYGNLAPLGVNGELHIAGYGVSRGYLNRVEWTQETFGYEQQEECLQGERFYRSGDMARWFPDGRVEFLGRIDMQIKIRGHRVELQEIEHQLLKVPGIAQAAVITRNKGINLNPNEEIRLCAYIVPEKRKDHEQAPDMAEIKRILSLTLPEYMVPSYFLKLEKLPLTPGGKLDREALPEPGITSKTPIIAPRNEVERKLTGLWAEVLGIERNQIGIENNFFDLGGHSLKATIMASEVHKAFNVRIPLKIIFDSPVLKELAGFIRNTIKEDYVSIQAVEKKEFYPLSSAQKRLFILQQMNPGSTGYNMPLTIPVNEISENQLNKAASKLIQRHESLRTSFEIVDEIPVQRIYEYLDFSIEQYDCSGYTDVQSALAEIQQLFFRPFDLSRPPLLRVGSIKTDQGNFILVDMHHIISDGATHQLLKNEFNRLYEGEELVELKLQYKDYSEWQHCEKKNKEFKRQEEYWLNRFSGDIPVLEIPIDFQRPKYKNLEGDVVSFELDTNDTIALKKMVKNEKTTLFTVLLTVFYVFISKISSQEDIVVGVPIVGRRHSDLKNLVGIFINNLAVRNFPSSEKTFTDFLREVKENVLQAFENQDYPFDDLVEKLAVRRDANRNQLFDLVLNYFEHEIGNEIDLPMSEEPQPINRSSINDMTLYPEDHGDTLAFHLLYCVKLFKRETIERFIEYFKEIVSVVRENKGIKLGDITISHGLVLSDADMLQENLEDFGF